MSRPLKISIITACFNSEAYIAQTIESVLKQTYPFIEYIIVDGKSTDTTTEIIYRYIARIDHFISEPDGGMYDAINKGLKLASGDYILNLNSDDRLVSEDTIERVVAAITSTIQYDYFYGNIIHDNGKQERKIKVFSTSYKCLIYSNHSTFVPHPCFFISKDLNLRLGGYDTTYRYASDFDYILRALKCKNVNGGYLDQYITRFRVHDKSISASGKITPERIRILKANDYFSIPFLKRKMGYFLVWSYYKIVNLRNNYRPRVA